MGAGAINSVSSFPYGDSEYPLVIWLKSRGFMSVPSKVSHSLIPSGTMSPFWEAMECKLPMEELESSLSVIVSELKKDEERDSSSLPALVVTGQLAVSLPTTDLRSAFEPVLALLPLDFGLLRRGAFLRQLEREVLGMINFLGASFKFEPVKLLARRRSFALTLYFRHIHRRESSGSIQWYLTSSSSRSFILRLLLEPNSTEGFFLMGA
mmetsp:Transcript_27100/g.48901  ORF Transcript_27100/g.48901 Transcript_27100/m.48901 type:complete len:209 (-) Transcript_27100:1251-1877(-)